MIFDDSIISSKPIKNKFQSSYFHNCFPLQRKENKK